MNTPARVASYLTASLLYLLAVAEAGASPANDQLLPASTIAYVSIRDMPVLVAHWRNTDLRRVFSDPRLDEYVRDVRQTLEDKWLGVGLTWEEFREVSAGETSLAVCVSPGGKVGRLVLLDITGRAPQAARTLAKLDARLQARGAKLRPHAFGGTDLTVAELPERGHQVVHFAKDSRLVFASSVEHAQQVLGQWSQPRPDNLAGDPDYQAVMRRCRADAGEDQPDITWFFKPWPLAEWLQGPPVISRSWLFKMEDFPTVLKKQGFDTIRAAGGFCHLGHGPFDLMCRVAVHAPEPTMTRGRSLARLLARLADARDTREGMRMLRFPNAALREPNSWVPADAFRYTSLNWNIRAAFEGVGPIVDGLFGEPGVFEDTLMSVREDPNGPRLDLRKDLVAHLGDRMLILAESSAPMIASSARNVVAIETTNERALAASIERAFKDDPSITPRVFRGYVIYSVHLVGEEPRQPQEPEQEWCVALGHLFIASQAGLIDRLLVPHSGLAEQRDYLRVSAGLRQLANGPVSAHAFVRVAEDVRLLDILQSLADLTAKRALVTTLAGYADEKIQQQLDSRGVPELGVVARHVGPAGWFARSEDNGWFAVGFTLKARQPAPTCKTGAKRAACRSGRRGHARRFAWRCRSRRR